MKLVCDSMNLQIMILQKILSVIRQCLICSLKSRHSNELTCLIQDNLPYSFVCPMCIIAF